MALGRTSSPTLKTEDFAFAPVTAPIGPIRCRGGDRLCPDEARLCVPGISCHGFVSAFRLRSTCGLVVVVLPPRGDFPPVPSSILIPALRIDEQGAEWKLQGPADIDLGTLIALGYERVLRARCPSTVGRRAFGNRHFLRADGVVQACACGYQSSGANGSHA